MTPPRKPSAILRAIGERIGRPEAWSNRLPTEPGTYCIVTALAEICDELDCLGDVELSAYRYLQRATNGGQVSKWNDAIGRTHAEVLAANARAIELAESEGQ